MKVTLSDDHEILFFDSIFSYQGGYYLMSLMGSYRVFKTLSHESSFMRILHAQFHHLQTITNGMVAWITMAVQRSTKILYNDILP